MKKLFLALSVTALASSPVLAEEPNPWTQCGIGAAIFKDSEVGAAVSNVIWDLGTTAVSSYATSPGTCSGSKMNVAAAEFIQNSHAVLEEDMSKGHGQHLSSLMDLMGVEASNQDAVASTIKADFSKVVASKAYQSLDDQAKAQAIYAMVISKA